METNKFKQKILSLISKSLKEHKIPIKLYELINNRDRYFLVSGTNGDGRKKRILFLRYDKWFFPVYGMNKIPEDIERREYTDHVRTVLHKIERVNPQITINQIGNRLSKVIEQRERA